ncbi:hypothetical protein Anapl_06132 [Anas platyrhynchos]|uniref:Uncharacterized protein n=1 Tax=Anas platyrhynchos TaxID=8839 RepID=R0L6R7_ANAPL|nr:hypothetical protein Anapl_06132 [Anas platyrhynchos]
MIPGTALHWVLWTVNPLTQSQFAAEHLSWERRLFLCLGSWRSVPQRFVPACCCARGQLAELRPLPSAKPDCFSFIQRPVIS